MSVYEIKLTRNKVSDKTTPKLNTPEEVVSYAQEYCFNESDAWREQTVVILLDKYNNAIGHFLMSIGTHDKSLYDIRIMTKVAIESNADKVVMLHNHPDENPKPSRSDINATEKIGNSLKLFDIELTDHIILTENEYFSFAEDKAFERKKSCPNPASDERPDDQ